MAKDKSAKKDRSEKKEKRSEKDGVHKTKKDKKSKSKTSTDTDVTTALFNSLDAQNNTAVVVVGTNGDVVKPPAVPLGALVPFANPLADEKVTKKVLKGVKKAAKHRTLKRGVKEVVKSLRKSAPAGPGSNEPPGVVILAADISPMDVISHIPVLCEDHNVPYLYVTSRAELGAAGNTKRPTSVVMVGKERTGKKKDGEEGDDAEYQESYKELLKVVEKESRNVRI